MDGFLTQLLTMLGYQLPDLLACVAGGCGVALLPSWIRSMDFRGVRFCEVRDGRSLPSLDLSAIWPARSTPTLADLFAHLDLGKD